MLPLCICGCGKEVTHVKNRYLKGHQKGMLGKTLSEETRLKLIKSATGRICSENTRSKISKMLINHIVSDETKQKISESSKGRIYSKEYKSNMSKICKGKKLTDKQCSDISKRQTGKKHSAESKLKMRLARIKYIESHYCNNNPMVPCIGKNEKEILDQLENSINEKIVRNSIDIAHALGKYPDGFIPKYNVIVEVDEKIHYKNNGELKDMDKERELLLASGIGCIIYRIKDQEFISDPVKEITKFKNFIEMVKIC